MIPESMWKVFFGIEADDVRLASLATSPPALYVGSCPGVNTTQSMKTPRRTYRVYRQGRAPPPHIIGGYPTTFSHPLSHEIEF